MEIVSVLKQLGCVFITLSLCQDPLCSAWDLKEERFYLGPWFQRFRYMVNWLQWGKNKRPGARGGHKKPVYLMAARKERGTRSRRRRCILKAHAPSDLSLLSRPLLPMQPESGEGMAELERQMQPSRSGPQWSASSLISPTAHEAPELSSVWSTDEYSVAMIQPPSKYMILLVEQSRYKP